MRDLDEGSSGMHEFPLSGGPERQLVGNPWTPPVETDGGDGGRSLMGNEGGGRWSGG